MTALDQLRSSGRVQRIPVPEPVDAFGPVRSGSLAAVDLVGPVSLPIRIEAEERVADWYVGRSVAGPPGGTTPTEEVSVLRFGEAKGAKSRPRVRIHSACSTGDILGSLRCDCGPQLRAAIRQIDDAAGGSLLIYMTAHEGRGIGLWSKAAAYLLQEEGLDTYAANRALDFEDDQRDFRLAAAVVQHFLGDAPFELLTNNPFKVRSLERLGVTEVTRRGLVAGASAHNRCYLRAKRGHGHLLPE